MPEFSHKNLKGQVGTINQVNFGLVKHYFEE